MWLIKTLLLISIFISGAAEGSDPLPMLHQFRGIISQIEGNTMTVNGTRFVISSAPKWQGRPTLNSYAVIFAELKGPNPPEIHRGLFWGMNRLTNVTSSKSENLNPLIVRELKQQSKSPETLQLTGKKQ
jgi:hypothetical protein